MPTSLDQIMPALEQMGVLAYWIIGLASLVEAWFVTGVFIPGSLAVDAGGILVQQGVLDFLDLLWFVAIGSILGGELSYWTGRLSRRGLGRRRNLENSATYRRAEQLFARYGGAALVVGRLMGPLSGLVALVAAITAMSHRRFMIWNIIAALPYAFGHVALGYFLGDVLGRFGPLVTRVGLFAVALLAGLAVLWWLVLRLQRMLPFLKSIGRSVVRAIVENPDVVAWSQRHPKTARQIARRLETGRFFGLPATLMSVIFAYVLFIWVGAVFDFLNADPILQADDRVANLMHSVWTPTLLHIFTYVTAFGDWTVVTPVLIAALLGLILRGRRDLAAGLAAAVIGSVLTVAVLSVVFHRARPALAYFTDTSNSYPSGHAAISIAFWGMLFYAAWRSGRLGVFSASLAATMVAALLGFSRIFLIENYLSDVVNGWLIGGMWMMIGIAIAEWRKETGGIHAPILLAGGRKGLAIGLVIGLIGLAGLQVADYEKTRNIPSIASVDIQVPDVTAAVADPGFAHTTESLLGTPLEPVNVIVLAGSLESITATMARAGWSRALNPGVAPLARAAWAAWTNTAYDTAPVTPYFWNGQPNDAAYEKLTADNTLRKRHHIRIWRSNYVLPDGRRIFVGAASFDDGMDSSIYHHIAPDIDTERNTVVADLVAAGAQRLPSVTMSPPRLGQSVAGDPWFTDGSAAVVALN